MAFKMKGSPFQRNFGSSPMKSLFGLGKDNKEARRKNKIIKAQNKAAKKQYREEMKEWKDREKNPLDHMSIDELKEYRQHEMDLADWETRSKEGTSDKSLGFDRFFGTAPDQLGYKEIEYADANPDMFGERGKHSTSGGRWYSELYDENQDGEMSNKEIMKRNDDVRDAYEEDAFEKDPKPHYTHKLNPKPQKPTKIKKKKLDYTIKVPGWREDDIKPTHARYEPNLTYKR